MTHSFFALVFFVFLFCTHDVNAQNNGGACTVSGRTQMSTILSEGLLQCRSGSWSQVTQQSSGSTSDIKSVIQHQKILLTNFEVCTDNIAGFVGFDPIAKKQMICGGTSKGWKAIQSTSSSSSSQNQSVTLGNYSYTSGGSPNYCKSVSSVGVTSYLNYGLQCSETSRCSSQGECSISNNTTISAISSGQGDNCIIKDGNLYCWGRNLFTGTTNSAQLVSIPNGGVWNSITSSKFGNRTFCGIKSDNTLWCWGSNNYGQVGDGTVAVGDVFNPAPTKTSPVQISVGNTWNSVTTGGSHTCGIRDNNTLWCWGDNSSYNLGTGNTTQQLSPIQISAGNTWKMVTTGLSHTCGIRSDDSMLCWGSNGYGQLGVGDTNTRSNPTVVSGGGTWKYVSAGEGYTCGIKSNDTLWCWGYNNYGQLGDGTTVNKNIPVQVFGSWKQVSASKQHVCGIRTDDSVWCWGNGDAYRVNPEQGGTFLKPNSVWYQNNNTMWSAEPLKSKFVSVGNSHTCVVEISNKIYCWGNSWGNDYFITGVPDTVSKRMGLAPAEF